jgi:hypothetical protein
MSLVSTTHELSLFWHSISLKKRTALIHRFPSHETDAPYRWSKSWVFRLPFSTRGIVIGRWRDANRTEEEALLAAMSGRDVAMSAMTEEQKVTIRRNLLRKDSLTEQKELLTEAISTL